MRLPWDTLPSNFLISRLEVAPDGKIWASYWHNQLDSFTIIRSIDNGQTFNKLFTGPNEARVYDFVFANNFVFASTGYGLYHSWNGGNNWQLMNDVSGLPLNFTSIVQTSTGKLLGAMGTQLWESNPGGSWTQKSMTGADWKSPLTYLFRLKSGTILGGGATAGIWRSTDNGSSWAYSSDGIKLSIATSMNFNPISKAIFANTENGLYRSDNNSEDWLRVWENTKSAEFSNNGLLFILSNKEVHVSMNDGNNWTDISPDAAQLGSLVPKELAVSPNGVLFLYTNGTEYFTSFNNGASWKKNIGIISGLSKLKFINDSIIFSQSHRSIDLGKTWSLLPIGIAFYRDLQLAQTGQLIAVGAKKVFSSNDLGITWETLPIPDHSGSIGLQGYKVLTDIDDNIFVLTQIGGVLYSDDLGQTWGSLTPENWPSQPIEGTLNPGKFLFLSSQYRSIWRTRELPVHLAKLTGQITKDQNLNCLIDPTDFPLENWLVEARDSLGNQGWASTDSSGHYRLGFLLPDSTTTTLTLEVQPPNALWLPCDSLLTVLVSPADDTASSLDFPMDAVVDCPLLTVSMNFWPARPCFPLIVAANWCNEGTLPADSATLEIRLDPLISVDSASWPILFQSGDTLVFSLGDVQIGECGQLKIFGQLDCDTQIGQSICCSTHVRPDSICGQFANWSGATLRAAANCVGDSLVHFIIENIGSQPSTAGLEYVVIEDQILLHAAPVPSLQPGQQMTFGEAADGSTLRLEVEQEPGHPVSMFAAAWVEGCGENAPNPPIFGWILPFLGDDGDPFSDDFCREATAAYDPNLKEALPVGYGPEHFIRPGQPLDYTIHFQNTGNDTAFQVVLRDTISEKLDLASLRMGPSSHPFDWEIYGPRILKIIFRNILLPDSTTNEPASHGHVSFQIDQKKGLELGTQIFNHAGIYFDFNPPILTNETWHTLGDNFLKVKTWSPVSPGIGLRISPNPTSEEASIELQGIESQRLVLKLTDLNGREMRQLFSENGHWKLRRPDISHRRSGEFN